MTSDNPMTQEMQGRFRIWYDYDMDVYFFSTIWGPHRQKRTVTKDEAEELKRMLMGGFIR
jgi:hypothetical protein